MLFLTKAYAAGSDYDYVIDAMAKDPSTGFDPADPDAQNVDAPQTGDAANPVLYLALLVMSGAGTAYALTYRRKSGNR